MVKTTKTPLYVILAGLILLVIQTAMSQSAVPGQADIKYGYLQSEEGDATASGGKRFVDMRNGNSWICDWKRCTLEGRFPLEQVETKTQKEASR